MSSLTLNFSITQWMNLTKIMASLVSFTTYNTFVVLTNVKVVGSFRHICVDLKRNTGRKLFVTRKPHWRMNERIGII